MEALERRGIPLTFAAILLMVLWTQCGAVAGGKNSTKMSYVCPPEFIRLGHSCYYFSEGKATWQNALFYCKDKDSNLSVPARWEDRHLRKYLNTLSIVKASRWIGGIYDSSARAWKWGGALQQMRYQSFSKMKKMTHEQLQWHCIAMMPELHYRWAPRSCFEPRQYICQTKLRKMPKSKVPELQLRFQRMGLVNEITVPSVSREDNDPRSNDVTSNPVLNPKSLDVRPSPLRLAKDYQRGQGRGKGHNLRPNELKKRSRPTTQRRLKRPFPGYQWNRRDPEASYQYNVKLLESGRTGLTAQQVRGRLAWLRHMRNRQLERRRQRARDWLVNEPRPGLLQTHARTYTVDNNISALHPKEIVEQFDMMLPPPVVLPRPARGAG